MLLLITERTRIHTMANTTYPDKNYQVDTRPKGPEPVEIVTITEVAANTFDNTIEYQLNQINISLLLILKQLQYITGEDE